ncbi:MAG: hypothetical protein AB1646_17315 [Thermodesulfobacteriota bacterium]
MIAGEKTRIPCALLAVVLVVVWTGLASAWDKKNRQPVKVRVSGAGASGPFSSGPRYVSERDAYEWGAAAGASRGAIFCPKRGYSFAIGMVPFFSTLTGFTRVSSKGGEGTFMQLNGHLRLPSENTFWEFYTHLRMWDKVSVRFNYRPWNWSGTGHAGTDGNFAGLALTRGDAINSDLSIANFELGADYDVLFGRDLIIGPHADFHIIKWNQRVAKIDGTASDYASTLLQPSIGAHIRYEPLNTGYFSWFNPYLEGRFDWMSFNGLALSTWDFGAGVAPPFSRNVDGGVKVGYRQWKLDGIRKRLLSDVQVEGPFVDFNLRF